MGIITETCENFMLDNFPHYTRKPDEAHKLQGSVVDENRRYTEMILNEGEIVVEEKTFYSPDGVRIKSDLYRHDVNDAPNKNLVICLHDYMSDATEDFKHWIGFYSDSGYDVLAINLRGHGRSDGEVMGLGPVDFYDVIRILDEYDDEMKYDKMAMHGIGMGAYIAMCILAIRQETLSWIFVDCPYRDLYSLISQNCSERGVPKIFKPYRANIVYNAYNEYFKLPKEDVGIDVIASLSDNEVPLTIVDTTKGEKCELNQKSIANYLNPKYTEVFYYSGLRGHLPDYQLCYNGELMDGLSIEFRLIQKMM